MRVFYMILSLVSRCMSCIILVGLITAPSAFLDAGRFFGSGILMGIFWWGANNFDIVAASLANEGGDAKPLT